VPLEDLYWIVAPFKIDAGGVLDAHDLFTPGQNIDGELLRYHDDAINIAKDEISGIDNHRLSQFAGNKDGHLMVQAYATPEGLYRGAVPGEDREVHRDQHTAIARAAVDQSANRPVSPGGGGRQLSIERNVVRCAAVADFDARDRRFGGLTRGPGLKAAG